MEAFGDYISFWAITNVLINKRVQLCDKRHKKHMLHLLSPDISLGESSETENLLLSLMPSRKQWVNLGKKNRYMYLEDGEHSQKKTSMRCNQIALKWTIERDRGKAVKPPYLIRLESFVMKIQERIQEEDFSLSAPTIFPDKKDDTSCRPLCKFTNLEDAVIVILANKYLTELFNNQFYEESLAFRSKRDYHGEKNYVTSHHDAIARIKEYRRQFDRCNLYVSECDLQKFYDTVCHNVVRKCYYGLLKRVGKTNPGLCFDEINRVFEAYLKCYSFPKHVYRLNNNNDNNNVAFWEKNNVEINCRNFNWVEKELLESGMAKSKRGLMQMRIGVPQGGALSGLIANMVLNTVDFQVKRQMTGNDLYLRYCDDMIIFSTSLVRCKKLFSIYYNGVKKLRLIPHIPEQLLQFGKKEFWKRKSKNAYSWMMKKTYASEWIGFVGYEMRRDGMVRIRKKSFRKELDKQQNVVFEKVLGKIKNKERVSNKSLYKSIESKLVSMSVGKVAVWNSCYLKSEMCWSTGFKELELNPYSSFQLRELDRHRGMRLNAAAKRIETTKPKGDEVKRMDCKQIEEKKPDSMGMVHSYYYQFKKKMDNKHN